MMAMFFVGTASAQHSVLVAADAPLYSQPDGDDEKVKVVKNVDLEKDPYRVHYAELLDRTDGWVHVRTSSHSNACTRALGTNAPLGMELWVKPTALAKVVQNTVELTGTNGTKAVIYAGTPLRNNVGGTWTAAAKGLLVTGVIPEASIGQKFIPAEPTRSDFQPTHGGTAVFGSADLKIEATDTPAMPSGSGWDLERTCVRATGPLVEGSAPAAGAGAPDIRRSTARRIANAWPLKPGAVLTWPDGVYAGTLTHPYRLENDGIEDPPGKLCGPGLPNLVVCVDDPDSKESSPVRYIALELESKEKVEGKHPKGEVKGESASCKVQVDVSPKGTTQSVMVRGCADAFATASKEAVAQWTWKPHMVGGEAVPSRTYGTVEFKD